MKTHIVSARPRAFRGLGTGLILFTLPCTTGLIRAHELLARAADMRSSQMSGQMEYTGGGGGGGGNSFKT